MTFPSASWRGRKVLVTGGTGFIGSHLVHCLCGRGAVVTVASRSRTAERLCEPLPIERLHGDLREPEFAARCTKDKAVVFHCASKIAGLRYNARHPAEMMAYNTILDLQVLDAAARNGVPMVFYPSGALVYDRDAAAPVAEDGPISGRPEDACKGAAWAKRASERAIEYFIEEFGMAVLVARLCNVYGPGDDFEPETAHLIGNTIRKVANGESPEIAGDGSQSRSYLYVEDAIEAVMLLVERGEADGPVNIGSEVEVSVKEVVDLIIDVSGKPLAARFSNDQPRGLSRKVLDTTRLRRLTGFTERTPLRVGLERTYEWYRSQTARRRTPRGDRNSDA